LERPNMNECELDVNCESELCVQPKKTKNKNIPNKLPSWVSHKL